MVDVCVVGLGSIGLPTAVSLANAGHRVAGVDVDGDLVRSVNDGQIATEEPGLAEMCRAVVRDGRLAAVDAPRSSDSFVISVPTPLRGENEPNLDYVLSAAGAVGNVLKAGDLVILESTVPPGTTNGPVREILETRSGLIAGDGFALAYCPERVLPGDILREIVENDRLIGGIDATSTKRAVDLYSTFVDGALLETSATNAELAKLAENIYRDVNIALANEIANLSEDLGADAWEVIDLANRHPRVNVHQPGPGVGGYCIPVATWFLLAANGAASPVMTSARRENDSRPARTAGLVNRLLEGVNDPRVAVLGVAYKAGVGDARATPASEIIRVLEDSGYEVRAHDPFTVKFERRLAPLDEALDGADLVLVVTDHELYGGLDPVHAASLMRGRTVVDGRRTLDLERWRNAGFRVHRTGVGAAPGRHIQAG